MNIPYILKLLSEAQECIKRAEENVAEAKGYVTTVQLDISLLTIEIEALEAKRIVT